MKSKISGIVRRALVQVGDTVKAGDPLFEIGEDRDREQTSLGLRDGLEVVSHLAPSRRIRGG